MGSGEKGERPMTMTCKVLSFAHIALCVALLGGCGKGGTPPAASAAPKIIKAKSGIEMVLIPAGSFAMGSEGQKEDESPVHTVALDAFLMDRTEATQAQFAKFEIPDPSHYKGPQNPAEQINVNQGHLVLQQPFGGRGADSLLQ